METMGDLLERICEFASHEMTREGAKKAFGWNAYSIDVKNRENDESYIYVKFENGYTLFVRYYLSLDPTESKDSCEFTLGLQTDMRSRIRYDIHYAGYIHGQTDELGFNIAVDPVHVHDLNATLLHLLGLDHLKLTFRFQGRDYRLTDVHGQVVQGLLA